MVGFKNILVPVDFSNRTRLSLDGALMTARCTRGSSIFLLHVVQHFKNVNFLESHLDTFGIEMQNIKNDLKELRRKIPSPLMSIPLIRQGHVASEIVKTCLEEEIDLVVMTTEGRDRMDRIIHPSVTEEVVRSAPCPVIVLHLQDRKHESYAMNA